jgi:hypothetical protein
MGHDGPMSHDAARQFLRERGAAEIVHPGGRLLDHLVRTHDLLADWGAPQALALAGLCHAVYGTDGFPRALVPVADRPMVQQLVGVEAEAIIYLYGSCDRAATYPGLGLGGPRAVFVDRFTGTEQVVERPEIEAFALLSVANELDVARACPDDTALVTGIAELIALLAPHTPDAAALALAELGDIRTT